MARVFVDWGRRNIRREEIEAEAQASLLMFLISSCYEVTQLLYGYHDHAPPCSNIEI
jgi:hypothetical protein